MSLQSALRYLWEAAPQPDPEHPAWILGTRYSVETEWPAELVADVRSRLWLMYRTSFPLISRHPEGPSPLQLSVLVRGGPIDMSGFVSDIGWGCMIRTGQCLVANGLLHLEHGREWRRKDTPSEVSEVSEAKIVSLFADTPESPLSIHNFVAQGIPRGKLPGEWFGPSTVAQCIKQLSSVAAYVSEGMDVYSSELEFPVLVLCPVRLGINAINPTYFDGIKGCLRSKHSIGIAGGRTSASHYFYGFQNNTMFYHDPHVSRPALDPRNLDLESVHGDRIRGMQISDMDPSMLLGFLLRDRSEFEGWQAEMDAIPPRSRIIAITESRPAAPSMGESYVLCDESDPEMPDLKSVSSRESPEEEEVLVSVPQVADESSVII